MYGVCKTPVENKARAYVSLETLKLRFEAAQTFDQMMFELYKLQTLEELDDMLLEEEDEACRQLIERAQEEIEDYSYDPFKSFETNVAELDAILERLEADLEAERNKVETDDGRLWATQRIGLELYRKKMSEMAKKAAEAPLPSVPAEEREPALTFADVSVTDPFYDDVMYVYENGIMNGVADDLFDPDGSLTRAMIVTVLYRMEGEPEVTGEQIFTDVPSGEWYSAPVEWAASAGIVNGFGDGTFGPEDELTREQLATILFRYANRKGYDTSVGESTNILSYDDAFDIADWAMPAMQWACGAGLYDPAGTETALRPQDSATRAEVAAAVRALLEAAAD